MNIILPKTLCSIDSRQGPFFFLAGPVLGGGGWQEKCCEEIKKYFHRFYVALPCRYQADHPFYKVRMKGMEAHFHRQLAWERYYLDLASREGCIIFWLPLESRASPRTDGLPYAMDTRGELGEWRARLMQNRKLRVVVGAETGFPGLSQIEYNFKDSIGSFDIYPSLATTVEAAVSKAR
jgi:hypothetical protein